jgi:HKD family nuclease
MLTDGIRLQSFFCDAEEKIIICAPFIKLATIKSLLKNVSNEVRIEVYTRWKAHEILLGVSDLSVFDYISSLNRGEVYISGRLHAKFYRSDDRVIIGSANVTHSALGWVREPNIEFLVEINPNLYQVKVLEDELSHFEIVTSEIRDHFQNLVESLAEVDADNMKNYFKENEEPKSQYEAWLPACTVPEILYAVYSNESGGRRFSSGAIDDACSDIVDLGIPPGFGRQDFEIFVRDRLHEISSFKQFIDRASSVLTESEAIIMIKKLRPDYSDQEAKFCWNVVLEWVRVFFNDEIEIAPLSFEMRIKG